MRSLLLRLGPRFERAARVRLLFLNMLTRSVHVGRRVESAAAHAR